MSVLEKRKKPLKSIPASTPGYQINNGVKTKYNIAGKLLLFRGKQ
jgi:hypothetical protein